MGMFKTGILLYLEMATVAFLTPLDCHKDQGSEEQYIYGEHIDTDQSREVVIKLCFSTTG